MDFKWELREFKLKNELLKQVVTAQTPDLSHNNSQKFYHWVMSNIPAIKNNKYTIPEKFLAGASILNDENFKWSFNEQFTEKIRKNLSINTCNACHGGETGTVFTHIKMRRYGRKSFISNFLRNDLLERKKIIFSEVKIHRQNSRIH